MRETARREANAFLGEKERRDLRGGEEVVIIVSVGGEGGDRDGSWSESE